MGKKNEAARMLANLNGQWSNAACMGYCLIAMRRANLRPGAQRRVLMAARGDELIGFAKSVAESICTEWKIPLEATGTGERFQTFNPD